MDPGLEADLILKAQGGCRDALNRLVEEHRHGLEGFIELRMGPKLRTKLEPRDIYQETWLAAQESLGTFKNQRKGAFARWLAGIAEHVILDEHRHYFLTNRKRENASLDAGSSSSGAAGRDHWLKDSGAISPSRAAMRSERFERLKAALDQLSDDHRRALLLARAQELTVAEIAAQMERSVGAVSMLLLRASQRLKDILGDTGSFHLPPGGLDGSSPPAPGGPLPREPDIAQDADPGGSHPDSRDREEAK